MVSHTSPAIDGDWFDEELFEDQTGRLAAGFDKGDKDEEVNDGSTVVEALREEEDIDQETFPDICMWNEFPPKPNSHLWDP